MKDIAGHSRRSTLAVKCSVQVNHAFIVGAIHRPKPLAANDILNFPPKSWQSFRVRVDK
jgi:hypothetical protein